MCTTWKSVMQSACFTAQGLVPVGAADIRKPSTWFRRHLPENFYGATVVGAAVEHSVHGTTVSTKSE